MAEQNQLAKVSDATKALGVTSSLPDNKAITFSELESLIPSLNVADTVRTLGDGSSGRIIFKFTSLFGETKVLRITYTNTSGSEKELFTLNVNTQTQDRELSLTFRNIKVYGKSIVFYRVLNGGNVVKCNNVSNIMEANTVICIIVAI